MAQTLAEIRAELERVKAENAALKAKQTAGARITVKVSEKGGFSVYGMGRFPVTLYQGQWERLAAHMPEIAKFIAENADHPAVVAAREAHSK